LNAQQRPPVRQAVLQPRHVEQIDQTHLVHRAPTRRRQNSSIAAPSNRRDGSGRAAEFGGIDTSIEWAASI
jgi:hypothetical protein